MKTIGGNPVAFTNAGCPNNWIYFESGQYGFVGVYGQRFSVPVARDAMGIDWMTRAELAQAIPPAYTEYIGREMMRVLKQKNAQP